MPQGGGGAEMEEAGMRGNQAQEEFGSSLGLRGFVRIVGVNADGDVVLERQSKNIVTNVGRDQIIRLIANDLSGGTAIACAWVGTGTNSAPTVTDTNLQSSFTTSARSDVTASNVQTGTVRFTWAFATNEVNGSALGEVALFNHTHTATTSMFARSTHSVINKDTSMTLNYTYELQLETS